MAQKKTPKKAAKKAADYGKQICSTLSNKLMAECDDGFEMIGKEKVAR
jgi:hypothetical protein